MKRHFWKNKKVLITGGSGFVGSHLKTKLMGLGAKISIYDKNIKNYNQVYNYFLGNKPEIVYHLAAQSLIEIGKDSPLDTYEVNVRGTWNVLEVCRIFNVKKIIIASTTHVYGDNPNLPYKEEYYPQPSRPYETSKAVSDLIAQSYADTYNLPVEISRMVNLYGPGDMNLTRIFPKIINQLINNKNPKIFDVGAIRDFLYIDDAVDGYIKMAERNLPSVKRARVINFGSGKPIMIIELAEKIVNRFNNKKLHLIIEKMPQEREKEILQQYVSITKAKKLLNWKPKVTLDEGINKTIEFYRSL